MVTLLAYFVNETASSRAELPPPTTTISLSVKKSPSHVAQYEMPLPLKSASPGTPNVRDRPPGVRMILPEVYVFPSDNVMRLFSPSSSIPIIEVFDLIWH